MAKRGYMVVGLGQVQDRCGYLLDAAEGESLLERGAGCKLHAVNGEVQYKYPSMERLVRCGL